MEGLELERIFVFKFEPAATEDRELLGAAPVNDEEAICAGREEKLYVEDGTAEDEAEGSAQAPAIDGTALAPVPIVTRFVPQLAALARRRF